MNAIMNQQIFPFEVDIIFRTYSEVVRLWELPTVELVRDLYDDTVNNRLRDLYFELNPSEAGVQRYHPWSSLRLLSEDKINNLSELINMKVLLETRELIEVLDAYNIFYINDFEEYSNIPAKEVW